MNIEVYNDFNAKNLTTFKISGIIKRAYFPKNKDELVHLLKILDNPLVLGNCSNVLISSYGVNRDVIFTKKCNNIDVLDDILSVECGANGIMASKVASENGLGGLEFMIGFPGSIGGEIYMNASAQNQCISDYLVCADIFDKSTKMVKTLSKEDLNFSYRHSICQDKEYVVLSGTFMLPLTDKKIIKEKMDMNLKFRHEHQPSLKYPNCGSVFKNPENTSAGKLLDEIGAKTLTYGGAKVWENHANFIINQNNASSSDILNLMLLMYNKVNKEKHITLKPELIYIGSNSKEEENIWKILNTK
jgi:UDP-N-acetylmuramate dehydrogenase